MHPINLKKYFSRKLQPIHSVFVLISLAVIFLFTNTASAEPGKDAMSAEKVMQDVDDRYKGTSREMVGTLTLFDKNGGKRVRNFKEIAKKYGKDEKSISVVSFPAEVKGTSIMSFNWDEKTKDDDTWLYLPQLKKVKRMASTDKSGYFLGSDFTYSDFVGLEISDFKYKFDEEKNKSGTNEWVIIAEPRDDIAQKVRDETGYKKIQYWIDQSNLIIVKAIYWLDEGNKIKYSSSTDIENIDNVWTIKKMQMIMTQGGKKLHSSVFQLESIKYNLPVDDAEFTVYAMEREIK